MKATRPYSLSAALLVTISFLSGLTQAARAEVTSLTLGITTNCPYGLAG